ncbi:MAG: FecR family protein [Steroidobacteraceae bacterium]
MRHSNNRRRPPAAFLARMLLAGVMAVLLPLQAVASPAADDIVVVDVKGEVQVTSGGTTQGARAGTTLDLPAAIQTGRDGSIDLRQGDTTIGVGPDTQLDFPAPAASAGAIDRVVQPRGNAYYNVGPRGNQRLRVETPYLVAVIKGTQFNVAVTPDSSTISLHEGRLEVLATESGIAAVELNAGEVAIRKRGEKTIRVLQVKNGAGSSAASGGGSDGTTTALVPSGKGNPGPEIPDDGSPLADDVDVDFGPGNPGLPASPVDDGVAVDVDGAIDEFGGVPVGADAGVDLGAGTVDAGADAGIDLGPASVDTGVEAEAELGAGTVDASLDAGADLGAAGADTAADAGVDLGAGTVDAGVDAGVDLGSGVEADLGADAAVDAGAGSVDAGLDADVAGADAGVDLGVDLTGSDAGLDIGTDVLGADIDLRIGGETPASDATGAPDNDDSGGLLGGILGRPRL